MRGIAVLCGEVWKVMSNIDVAVQSGKLERRFDVPDTGRKLSSITIDYVVSLTLAFFVVFKISFVPETAMQVLKCASIALLILLHRRAASSIPHFWVVITLACVQPLCTLLAGSPFMNVLYAAVNGLCLISLLLMFRSLSNKHGVYQVLDTFFWMLLIAAAANDATVIASSVHEADTEYLLGNKFAVGYIHMLLLGLYATLLAKRKGYLRYNWGLFWLIFAESIIVIYRADTMTCMLGLVAVAVISPLIPKRLSSKLSSGVACVATLIGINVVFFGTGMMLENEFVRYFITEVLGRNLNLTGRTAIYDELGMIIQMSPYVGWGYGSSVVSQFVGSGNAQNGIMELLVTYGVIGTLGFLCVLIALLPGRKNINNPAAHGLVAVLYGMFFASLVEISFGIMFYLMLSLASTALQGNQKGREVRSDS